MANDFPRGGLIAAQQQQQAQMRTYERNQNQNRVQQAQGGAGGLRKSESAPVFADPSTCSSVIASQLQQNGISSYYDNDPFKYSEEFEYTGRRDLLSSSREWVNLYIFTKPISAWAMDTNMKLILANS